MTISISPDFPSPKADWAAYISKYFKAYPEVFSSLMDESGTINLLTSKRLAALHKKMVETLDDYNIAIMEKNSAYIGRQEALKVNGESKDDDEIGATKDTNVSEEETDEIKDTVVSDPVEHSSSTSRTTSSKGITKKRSKSQV